MNAADVIAAPTDRAKPVDMPRRGGRLKIFTRDDGQTRLRFVSDDVVVREAELVDVAFFDHQAEADAVAQACADILTITGGTAPDQYGWHLLSPQADLKGFISTLLGTARDQAGLVAAREPAARNIRRRWSRDDFVYFAFLVGQGHDAKAIAAELRMTVANVYQRAHRLGLSLVDRPHHVTSLRLPADVQAGLDSIAQKQGLRRDTFLSRWMIKAYRGDHGRYGLVSI